MTANRRQYARVCAMRANALARRTGLENNVAPRSLAIEHLCPLPSPTQHRYWKRNCETKESPGENGDQIVELSMRCVDEADEHLLPHCSRKILRNVSSSHDNPHHPPKTQTPNSLSKRLLASEEPGQTRKTMQPTCV